MRPVELTINPRFTRSAGYTLIELIVVVTVLAILASVAVRSIANIGDVSRLEETKSKLEHLAFAIGGDPKATSGGGRSDFGYIGDNGCLPSSLDELIYDSHAYSTWNGPYLKDRFSSGGTDTYFKSDGWGQAITISDVILISTGSGTTLSRSLANGREELLYNDASFSIVDLNFTPPGPIYKDSVRFNVRFPRNGIMQSRSESPDANGYVAFDSIPIGIHTLALAYLPANDTIIQQFTIEPGKRYYADLHYPADIWGGSVISADTLVWADFDAGSDGFVYGDDLFRGTSRPYYASGIRQAHGGYSGGALEVTVGGRDNNTIHGMSGGWSLDFTVPTNMDVDLSLRYNLSQTNQYESDERSQALVSIDGTLYGTFPNDYIVQIAGDGPGGGLTTTGWQIFQVNIGVLSAGLHTISIGTYNNKKTAVNESTEILIDEVLLVPHL